MVAELGQPVHGPARTTTDVQDPGACGQIHRADDIEELEHVDPERVEVRAADERLDEMEPFGVLAAVGDQLPQVRDRALLPVDPFGQVGVEPTEEIILGLSAAWRASLPARSRLTGAAEVRR